MEKIKAFTLAETLITLGIIGIVAAMTLPALMDNAKKTETSARLKKFSSVMSQALIMSELKNGDMNDWTYGGGTVRDEDGNPDFEANGKITKEFFMTYLAPYFKYTNIVDGKNAVADENGDVLTPANNTIIYLADSSKIDIWNGSCMDINFDVNGDSKPNVKGKDIFVFLFCPLKSARETFCGNIAFCSYFAKRYNSREAALGACKTDPNNCSRLLEMDNWEFKKDYPYKL